MSGRDRGVPRRAIVAGLALALAMGAKAAFADVATFAERFVEFDPPVTLPSIALLDRHGHAASLVPRRGRTLLIAVWAVWCPPCHRDIPRLAVAQPGLARDGIDVALVNIDAAPPAIVLTQSIDIATGAVPLFFDPGGDRLAAPAADGRRSPFQRFGMPILYVVDGDDRVRGYVKGSIDWTAPGVRAFFRALAGPARVR